MSLGGWLEQLAKHCNKLYLYPFIDIFRIDREREVFLEALDVSEPPDDVGIRSGDLGRLELQKELQVDRGRGKAGKVAFVFEIVIELDQIRGGNVEAGLRQPVLSCRRTLRRKRTRNFTLSVVLYAK